MGKTLEKQIEELIIKKSGNVHAFAIETEINYGTLRNILRRGLMNANVQNVITICQFLDIDVESLADGKIVPNSEIKHTTTVQGNNHGIAGMSGDIKGDVTFNATAKDEHSICREQEITDNSTADRDVQAMQVTIQQQTFNNISEINKTLKKLLAVNQEILEELRKSK